MFTAKIKSVEKNKTNFTPTVEFYKDGVLFDTVTVPGVYPFSAIGKFIEQRIKQYEDVDSFDTASQIGDFVAPAKDADLNNYLALRAKLNTIQLDVNAGIVAADNPDYLALKQAVADAWKKEYSGF